MRNAVSAVILGLGGFASVKARPWWESTFTAEYNPAVVILIFVFIAFMVRGLMDPD